MKQPLLCWTLVALLLGSPVVAGAPLSVDVEAEGVSGQSPATASAGLYFLGIPKDPGSPTDSSWTFQAERMVVTLEIENRTRTLVVGQQNDRWNETFQFDQVVGASTRDGSLSYASVEPVQGPAVQEMEMPRVTTPPLAFDSLKVRQDVRFSMGGQEDSSALGSSDLETYRVERSARNIEVTDWHRETGFTVEGAFEMTVYDFDFHVIDEDGKTNFKTGREDRAQPKDILHSPRVDYNTVRAHILFEGATLVIDGGGRAVQANLATLEATPATWTWIHDAEGRMVYAGKTLHLSGATLSIDPADIVAQITPGPQDRMHVSLQGDAGAVFSDGAHVEPGSTVAFPVVLEVAPYAALVAVLLVAGVFLVRRMLRARRANTNLEDPFIAEAYALQALNLLENGDAGAALVVVEPNIGRFHDAGLLHMIYCLCLKRLGRVRDAARQLKDAVARHPGLYEEVKETELVDLLPDIQASSQSDRGPTPVRGDGYA